MLNHTAGTLPKIKVKLKILKNDIANIHWSWVPVGEENDEVVIKRMPKTTPREFIDNAIEESGKNLSTYFTVTDKPFKV